MFRLRAPPASIAALAAVGLSACLALRPQLPANLERVRQAARFEWLERGTCSGHELRRCENGHQTLTASDGFGYWTTAYDREGRLEFEVSGACMGVMDRAGTRPDCEPAQSAVIRDLCVESLEGLESRGMEINLDCVRPSRVRIPLGVTPVELVDGARLKFVVPVAPRQPFDLFFDGAPPGVVLKSCSELDGCVALDAGDALTSLRLSVTAPGRVTPCELWVSRSFLVRAGDAGVVNAK